MRPRPDAGQASAEYVGVLAVLAVVLALAGTAVAAPGLPGSVARHLRVALCIVGGDVCRDSDARAKGLEPCVTDDEGRSQDDSLSFGIGEYERGEWSATRWSDGRWVLRALRGSGGQLGAEVPKLPGPVVVDVGGTVRVGWMSGSEWELPEGRIRDLIDRMHGHVDGLAQDYPADYYGLPEPRHRYTEGGVAADLAASLTVGDGERSASLDLGKGGAELIVGRRQGAGGDVWYVEAGSALEAAALELGVQRAAVAEYHAGPPARLVMRGTTTDGDRQTEQVLTLPLRTARLRAAAGRALLGGDPAGVVEGLRAEAVVERRTYDVTSEEGGVDLQLGGFGFEHRTRTFRRTLAGAELLDGDRVVQRLDCLGLDRS